MRVVMCTRDGQTHVHDDVSRVELVQPSNSAAPHMARPGVCRMVMYRDRDNPAKDEVLSVWMDTVTSWTCWEDEAYKR